MLFHNDCTYVAHTLLTLGHEFQQSIPLPITMAWYVPCLLAERLCF